MNQELHRHIVMSYGLPSGSFFLAGEKSPRWLKIATLWSLGIKLPTVETPQKLVDAFFDLLNDQTQSVVIALRRPIAYALIPATLTYAMKPFLTYHGASIRDEDIRKWLQFYCLGLCF